MHARNMWEDLVGLGRFDCVAVQWLAVRSFQTVRWPSVAAFSSVLAEWLMMEWIMLCILLFLLV